MSQKRDRLEVIYDILCVIKEKGNTIKPTPLLRFSNLSSQRFTLYYEELLEKEFIEEVIDKKKRKNITLTKKGFEYIEKYKVILGFIDNFDL